MRPPRVVIETRRWAAAEALSRALRDAGLDPIVCTGPTPEGGACPLLTEEGCPVLEGADAVVYDLDLDRSADRAILRTLLRDHAGLPVVTERTRDEARRHADVLEHCAVVVPYSPGATAQAVVDALRGASHDPER